MHIDEVYRFILCAVNVLSVVKLQYHSFIGCGMKIEFFFKKNVFNFWIVCCFLSFEICSTNKLVKELV